MNKIIEQQPNRRGNFFNQLLSKGKEGKIIFPGPNAWSIALSKEILITIISLADNDFGLSYEDWVNFFSIYILNWNNDVNTNFNVSEQNVIDARNEFISTIYNYGYDLSIRINFIGQARNLLQQYPESEGFYLTTYHHPSIGMLIPWNNQMTIDDCW